MSTSAEGQSASEPKLEVIGEPLPTFAAPVANYLPYVVHDKLIYISGQIPTQGGQVTHRGLVGEDLSLEEAQHAARRCAINIIAAINHAIDGDWARFDRVIKIGGFVNAGVNFNDHPAVINGASNLLAEVFGERGRHARFAVGASSLPLGVSVEIDAIVALR